MTIVGRNAGLAAFGAMTLAPVGLLLAGLVQGGWVAVAALSFITGVVWGLDRFAGLLLPALPAADEFPVHTSLAVVLGICHLGMLPVMVWGLAGGVTLSPGAWVALFLGFGLWLGQVSNSNAHELIHRPHRALRALGVAVYTSIGYGQHVSAHRLVHHARVATADDPNTARRGEGFYRFLLRAWPGELRAGWQAETARLQRAGGRRRPHPYAVYAAGTGLAMGLAFALGGWSGVAVWLGLAGYAQVQMLLSDYVQHYGLARQRDGQGRLEPVGPQHSWDAPHWASGVMMLHAPRHGDHHCHPARAYPALELAGAERQLPYSLPVMATIALYPRLWFRVMHRRLGPAR